MELVFFPLCDLGRFRGTYCSLLVTIEKHRKAEIAMEVYRYSLCSTKRAVKYYRGLLVQLEDLVDVLSPREAGAPYATTHNVKEVNFSVERVRRMVSTMAEEVQHMLDMEIDAATFALNWKWKAENRHGSLARPVRLEPFVSLGREFN